jgi:hypothetical protein
VPGNPHRTQGTPGASPSSDHPHPAPAQAAPAKDAPAVQRKRRVTNTYATPWRMTDGAADRGVQDYLRLWRFEQYYRLSPLVLVLARAGYPADADTDLASQNKPTTCTFGRDGRIRTGGLLLPKQAKRSF